MVAVWNRALHIPLTFTNDLAAAERQLDEVKKQSAGGLGKDRRIMQMRVRFEIQKAQMASGSASTREIQAAYDNSILSAGFYAEEQSKRAKNFAADVEELMRGVAGVPGKKILVLVGENFPQFPGVGVFEYVNELFNTYSRLLRMRNAQVLASGRSLSHLVPKLTRTANAHGIAIHTIFSGETPSERADRNTRPQPWRNSRVHEHRGSFGTLSRDTGGVATLGSRNFDLPRPIPATRHYYTCVADRKCRQESQSGKYAREIARSSYGREGSRPENTG